MTVTPLEDPRYEPVHKPVDGYVPSVVAKWGPRSQLRWFDRFRTQLRGQRPDYWQQFYCTSTEHKSNCCSSCEDDWLEGYSYTEGCCCRASMAGQETEQR